MDGDPPRQRLSSITDVRPGVELVIPAGPIASADRALREALGAVQQATEQGARLFAAEQIGNGLRLYESAVTARKAGDWARAGRLADEARLAAGEALQDRPGAARHRGRGAPERP